MSVLFPPLGRGLASSTERDPKVFPEFEKSSDSFSLVQHAAQASLVASAFTLVDPGLCWPKDNIFHFC